MPNSPSQLNLSPFVRRIRLLRAWRLGTFGLFGGAGIALFMAIMDFFNIRFMEAWFLAVPIVASVIAGVIRALFEKIPESAIAQSVDRRADLSDRLTTATAFAQSDASLAGAVSQDAAINANAVRAKKLYPIRFGKLQGSAIAIAGVAIAVFLLGNAPFLKNAEAKQNAATLKKASEVVERVSKPILEAAKKPETAQEDKELAKRLSRFSQELNKGRLTKPEALQKANELAEQAKQLENQRQKNLQEAVQKAQTAGNQLRKMAEKGQTEKMSKSDKLQQMLQNSALSPQEMQKQMEQMKSQNQADSQKTEADMQKTQSEMDKLQKEMQEIEKSLKDGKDSKTGEKLSKEMSESLKKKLAELQKKLAELAKRLSDLKLSKEAQDTFAKLMETKEFKEAQEILQKLAQQMMQKQAAEQAQQMAENGQLPQQDQKVPELSEKDLKEMEQALREKAKKLEELAKQLKDPAKMKAFAEAMLAAAKAAKELGQCNGIGMGLAGAFSLPGIPGAMSMPRYGAGGPGDSKYMGPGWKLLKGQKSELIKNMKFQDKQVTSQIGDKGPETYIEVTGPAQLGKPSSIPYQNALPKYEKSAESALNKSEIPTRLKGKVRNYFDSLRR